MKTTGYEIKIVDEEVEEKINENTMRGNLLSRVLMKGDSLKHGKSFDMGCQIIRTEGMSMPAKPEKEDKRKGANLLERTGEDQLVLDQKESKF